MSSLQCNIIQMKPFTLWLFGTLLVTLTRADKPYPFPENYMVAKTNSSVTLICNTTTEEAVTWKFGNSMKKMENVRLVKHYRQDGQNLNISDLDYPMFGNYSCWKGAEMLSSVYLFIEEDLDNIDYLQCLAKSYHCNFTCTWNNSEYIAVRLELRHDCNMREKSCWISSSKQLPDGRFQFEISHSLSPYVEESTRFKVTAEAIKGNYFRKRIKTFYLRDIIQPDPPKIVKCQKEGDKLNVTIDPPSTWSTPHSFFKLEYEIEYKHTDDNQVGKSQSALIPGNIWELKVHCRDSLIGSHWSQWTPTMLIH
ncbi:interleukin-12 subunit beta [Antennarius striatus]|uniref:interleukin-12 subunit beta n=1 Tax=Antennarius striatus TaxID=241820 RepID=UPI0035AE2802